MTLKPSSDLKVNVIQCGSDVHWLECKSDTHQINASVKARAYNVSAHLWDVLTAYVPALVQH